MKETILVKFGGSLITDKTKKESLRKATLRRLCREIAAARKKDKGLRIILGHGGGSFPHQPAHRYKVDSGLVRKDSGKGFVLTNDAAARLNRHVVSELIKAGEPAVSVQPSAFMISDNGRIKKSFTGQMDLYLKNGFLPVPYGDAILDYRKGVSIVSTEHIFSELVKKLKIKRMIVAGKTAGVFTDDPLANRSAKPIPEINKSNYAKVKKLLKGSHGTDVTGGMLTKVEELYKLARKEGTECLIISGEKAGNVEGALLGKKVTGTAIK